MGDYYFIIVMQRKERKPSQSRRVRDRLSNYLVDIFDIIINTGSDVRAVELFDRTLSA